MDAIEWRVVNNEQMKAFLGDAYQAVLSKFTDRPSHLRFAEADGQVATAAPGDWVVRVGEGWFYRCPAQLREWMGR